jgi:formylglycine-generating enzyme required for sulfatase activity
VSWNDATAYCAWRAQRDGLPWRLPTRREREALTRGADGRAFPWGDAFDWTWTNGGRSRAQEGPLPAGSSPADVSPHGVLDLAGNVKEWCSSWQDRRTGHRAIRGGAWGDTERLEFEGWFEDGDPEDEHDQEIGFRIVRTVEPGK